MHDDQRHRRELRGQAEIGADTAVERDVQDVGLEPPQLLGEQRDRGEVERPPEAAERAHVQPERPGRRDQRTFAPRAEDDRPKAVAAEGGAGGQRQSLSATLAEVEKSEDHRAASFGRSHPAIRSLRRPRRPRILRMPRVPAAGPAYGTDADHCVMSPVSKPSANIAPSSIRKETVSKLVAKLGAAPAKARNET